ncbi:MAG: ribonuclease [Candidatus Sumerlaeota bacterium]|nr:ribonuclease [Candidatus Sumerlaeota bacterium]
MTPSPKRPKPEVPEYEYIESPKALRAFCKRLDPHAPLAVDTEFVGERTYYPELEVIQLTDGAGNTAVVDAKAIGKGEPLAALLTNASREKIFHSGAQDLPILERFAGSIPWPVFDTQLAAAMIGLGAQVSYQNLVEMCLGKRVDKGQTASDWSQRPLKQAQLDYAATDVAHLHALRAYMIERLEKMGRLEWYREEQQKRAEDSTKRADMADEELYTTVKEWMKLSGRQLAVLRELTAWREQEARRQNVPRKKIMPDPGLVGLSRIIPQSRADVQGARQLPAGPLYRYIDELLPLIRKASELPKEQWPKKPVTQRPDVPAGFVELMQSLVRTMAEQEQIASALLATSSELTSLVNNRHRIEDLDLPVLRGWRRELVGAKLIALLEGKLTLRIADRRRLEFEGG